MIKASIHSARDLLCKIVTCLSLFMLIVHSHYSGLPKAVAQRRETQSKDVRLIKNLPSVHLSFEREGKRQPREDGESDQGIWLRIRNNSKWQVGVCTFDTLPKEYGASVFYKVERFEGISNPEEVPSGYEAKGGCVRMFIAAGESLLFSIPREHLASGLAIKVEFSFEWESNTDIESGREPKHYAYFYSTDLPKAKGH